MTNSFPYGGVVGPSSFYNREKDLQVLRRTVDNAGGLGYVWVKEHNGHVTS